jgi:DNA modification methylase
MKAPARRRRHGRNPVRSARFDIHAAKAKLHRLFETGQRAAFAMYKALRDLGLLWIAICTWLDDPSQHNGKRISASQWAKDNAPIGKRWLDEHAKFAREEWDDFLVAWRWSQEEPYSPERHPSLSAARDLIDAKKRSDNYHSAFGRAGTPVRAEPEPQQVQAVASQEKIIVNPTTTILRGDSVTMMRKHIEDNSVNPITADPPHFMRVPEYETAVDYWNKRYGMTPRFRADWDRFDSLAEYEEFTAGWLREAIRCLSKDGSMFILCSHLCVGPINYLLQKMDVNIVQHIQVYKLNGRPIPGRPRFLRHSHHTIIWATKHEKGYKFNDRQVKMAVWRSDPFNNIRGQMKRDVWLIPNSGHENKTGFPAQKPVEEFNRILQMTGTPDGTMLDIFSGSGSGAIAALRAGMKSINIEREPRYVEDIVKRVKGEPYRRR